MVQDDASKTFVFVFPDYVGHLNPALPLARALVQLGHQVHILCRERMRTAIEDTGAIFHSDMECEPELFHSREGHGFGALESLKKEYDIEDDHIILALYKLGNVMCELQLPGNVQPGSRTGCSPPGNSKPCLHLFCRAWQFPDPDPAVLF